jgi:uncharacterized protein with gpF-like domain
MRPWNSYRMMPDPTAIYSTQQGWDAEVETILTTIGQIGMSAWSQATDVPPVSRHAFVMSQLATTQNFLVRIPDETYNLVFAEITDGVNGGDTVERIAERVDAVLTYTDSERWPNRARVIALTETTRARASGVLGAGTEMSRVTGRILRKTWQAHNDEKTRPSHRAADGQTVAFYQPFLVGGIMMMAPGDVTAPVEEVAGCRCDLVILNERER